MKRRVVYFSILFFWLASLFIPPTMIDTAQAQTSSSSPSPDRDYDGLTDYDETNGWNNAAGFFTTDPLDADSDDDGLSDGKEKLYDSDPLNNHDPGIYVEYEDHLKTRQYYSRDTAHSEFPGGWRPWGWQQFGDQLISFDAVVVRRGATFSVGGPATANISVQKSIPSLTDLTLVRDCCNGRWNVSVLSDGTVGKYEIVVDEDGWSKSLNLYVIFELPTPSGDLTQAMINAFLYDDDPDNLRDERSIVLADYKYYHGDYPDVIPQGAWINAGTAYRFELQQFEPYVLETHVIDTINGHTDQWDAADDLGARVDQVTRFDNPRVLTSSWGVLHPGVDDRTQCSNVAGLYTAFARSAGIPARVFFTDWVNSTFDHATELWLNGTWRAARGYRYRESEPCGWDCATGYNSPTNRYNWGRDRYRPWHSGGTGSSSTVMVADADWSWSRTSWNDTPTGHEVRWPSWDWDAIVRYSWFNTLYVPYWSYWGWTAEPTVTGTPPDDWPAITDFTVAVSPESQSIGRGDSKDYTITVDTSDGFSNDVDLSVSGLPGGTAATLDPESCVPVCNSTLTITPSLSTPLGNYNLTIEGRSGGLLRQTQATLEVTPPPDFTIDASPDSQTVALDSSVWYTVTLDALYGFDDTVNLSVTGLPLSTTATFLPSNSIVPPGDRYLYIFTASDTPTGTYTLAIHGNSTEEYHFTTVDLIVDDGSGSPLAASPAAFEEIVLASGTKHANAEMSHSAPVRTSARINGDDSPEWTVRGVDDYGVDLDGDGYFDQLVLELEINAAQAGVYWIQGALGADRSVPDLMATGGLIVETTVRADLEAGLDTVQLVFDGLHISTVKVDGPYVLKYLSILAGDRPGSESLAPERDEFANDALGHWSSLYTTTAYSADAFENWGAKLTDTITERGLDADGDKRYESLILNLDLDIFEPGTYTVRAILFDSKDEFVAEATWTGNDSTAALQFDGLSGTVGPYTLQEVSLLDSDGKDIDSMSRVYTTQQIIRAQAQTRIVEQSLNGAGQGQFELNAILPYTYTDTGIDLDSDGDYDLLAIDVQVEVEAGDAGLHRLEGWLKGTDGSLVAWTSSDSVNLVTGTHVMSLTFSGPTIYDHNINGPFTLTALKLLKGDTYEVLDEVAVAYTTASYTRDQFDSLPHLELPADNVMLLFDDVESGAGDWSADAPWAIATATSHSPTHAWSDSPGSNYADDTNVSLTTGSLDLEELSWPVLQFQTCYDLETGADYGYVEISTNAGITWTQVTSYTGGTAHWSSEIVDLGLIGGADTLQVRFRLETDADDVADGWHIDNVVIYLDNDLDDDGIPNTVEAGDDPANPVDTDDDGNPDYDDTDADGDGIPDSVEAGDDPNNPLDTDGDGAPDFQDDDADDDGIPDSVEAGDDPNNPVDTDDDGAPDYQDADSDDDGIPDSVEAGGDPNNPLDTDDDGTPDYMDADADGDGIPDSVEGTGDADDDGTPNYQDTDADGDGIPDAVEGTGDADDDGIPNYLDPDSDGDGIPDEVEGTGDADGDGIPNYLDPDSDGDGIPDSEEGTDDSDGDGIPDFLDNDSNDGPDGDADGDTILNKDEDIAGHLDADGDGIQNKADTDSDNDGILDQIEAGDSDTSTPPVNSDGDSLPDFIDTDSDNDKITDAGEWSTGSDDPLAGCTADDPICTDNDADDDGKPNYRDQDSDGDGADDVFEGTGDLDDDGIPNYLDADSVKSPEHLIFLPVVHR